MGGAKAVLPMGATASMRTAAETVVEVGSEEWQMGSTGAEVMAAAAGGAAEDGPGAAAEAAARVASGKSRPRPID